MTRMRTVSGMCFMDNKVMPSIPITVRVTKDKLGQSLSLAVDEIGFMLQIPIEFVKDMIEVKGEQDE